jgi:hypothetical protein
MPWYQQGNQSEEQLEGIAATMFQLIKEKEGIEI